MFTDLSMEDNNEFFKIVSEMCDYQNDPEMRKYLLEAKKLTSTKKIKFVDMITTFAVSKIPEIDESVISAAEKSILQQKGKILKAIDARNKTFMKPYNSKEIESLTVYMDFLTRLSHHKKNVRNRHRSKLKLIIRLVLIILVFIFLLQCLGFILTKMAGVAAIVNLIVYSGLASLEFTRIVNYYDLIRMYDNILEYEKKCENAGLNEFTGIIASGAKIGGSALAIVKSLKLVLPGIRQAVYWMYYSRFKLSDFSKTLADMLELNTLEIMRNESGRSEKEIERIVNKQKKLATRLEKFGEMLDIRGKSAMNKAKRKDEEIERDLNKITIDDINRMEPDLDFII